MKQRVIGDVSVSAIGLGGMPMSIEGRPDERQSIATIHAALENGVTLIDTADAYHLGGHDEVGHNEELIARAVREYHDDTSDVLIATKGGHLRPEAGNWAQNGHPEYLKEAAKASAKRLGVEQIGLYQFHRPDPAVPYADSIGALAELLDEGVIRMAGISNADPGQIRTANEVLGGRLASVQNQYSPKFRSSEPGSNCATSSASRSCRGAPSVASGARRTSARRSRTSPTSLATVGSPRRSSPWRGSCRRATSSCRSPVRPGRSRS